LSFFNEDKVQYDFGEEIEIIWKREYSEKDTRFKMNLKKKWLL
jgi:hypothetical protein